jgi:hypothetical protein
VFDSVIGGDVRDDTLDINCDLMASNTINTGVNVLDGTGGTLEEFFAERAFEIALRMDNGVLMLLEQKK